MSAVFITATGTDIGKTFVTAGLIRHVRGSELSLVSEEEKRR
jgi:dethiobiotin synthetase